MLAGTPLSPWAVNLDVSLQRYPFLQQSGGFIKLSTKKIISACLAGSIVLQRMGMEFILFILHSRDSSQADPLVQRAQADFSWSSRAGYIREGELELQAGEVSSLARAQSQGVPARPVEWDQCLKPRQGLG